MIVPTTDAVEGQASLKLLKDTMLIPEVLADLCGTRHVVICGTKSDVDDSDREISEEEGEVLCTHGAKHIHTHISP